MKIIVKGKLDHELIRIGIKPGHVLDVRPDPKSKVGAVHFTAWYNSFRCDCVLYPENYEVFPENITARRLLLVLGIELPQNPDEEKWYGIYMPHPKPVDESFDEFYQRVIIEKRYGETPKTKKP
jgi:hypothetical protein